MTEDMMEMMDDLALRLWQSFSQNAKRPAIEIGERSFSYSDLYDAAASLAQAIIGLDDPNPFVAVMADKSFTCYAGILAAILAGKAYLPLNPRFPSSRNRFFLEKARIRVLIAGETSDEELEETLKEFDQELFILFPEEMEWREKARFFPKITEADQPAYLLFTSGTTGEPKGVAVTRASLASYLDVMHASYDFNPYDRFTQLFDLTFDLSVHDMFVAWTSGACLCVAPDNSSFAMSRYIRDKQVSVWFSVPSVVNLMERMRLLKPDAFPTIRLSFFCGEALQSDNAGAWKQAAPESKIVNLYGPTEATIAISRYDLPEDLAEWKKRMGMVSIGKIFEGNECGFVDDGNAFSLDLPVDDEPKELCVSGNQVIHNYFRNEMADAEAFVIDPKGGKKWYRTGDLVQADEKGDLYFLGRKDAEVKISGYRVNLKEIEYTLNRHSGVGQAFAVYEPSESGSEGIIAFIIPENAEDDNMETDLALFCRELMPWYMVPGKFIFVSEFPFNVNGKVDRNALVRKYLHGK
jgi:amino acid adenylation domain-containing protein